MWAEFSRPTVSREQTSQVYYSLLDKSVAGLILLMCGLFVLTPFKRHLFGNENGAERAESVMGWALIEPDTDERDDRLRELLFIQSALYVHKNYTLSEFRQRVQSVSTAYVFSHDQLD